MIDLFHFVCLLCLFILPFTLITFALTRNVLIKQRAIVLVYNLCLPTPIIIPAQSQKRLAGDKTLLDSFA